ncbi:hypothetical protein HPK19_12640 [Arthrobacter citreus]|nr:hypothetical protein HPK19_12640 [Arthrobacter citreus]
MKKILSLGAILFVIFYVFYINLSKSPKLAAETNIWVGTTKDGNIQAVLSEGLKGHYDGEFRWTGTTRDYRKAIILHSAYLVNNKTEAGGGAWEEKTKVNDSGFVDMTSKPEKNEKIEVMVEYKIKNKTIREIVPLHNK